ncbi:hypothetical protein D9M73_163320 [compost metagenome]
MNQVVQVGHLAVGVGDDREVHQGALGVVDVIDPAVMGIHRIHRQRDHLHATRGELVLELGGETQLGGAHRGEVGRVREQHAPAAAQPLVEADLAFAGFLFEVGGDVAESEAHGAAPWLGSLWGYCACTGIKTKRINIDLFITFKHINQQA